MLKHMISPGTGASPGINGERTNHSIDSYSSERNLAEGTFVDRSRNGIHSNHIYGNGPYVINGHDPHLQNSRIPNGHVHLSPTPRPLDVSVQRYDRSRALGTLSTSKHSLGGTSGSVSPGVGNNLSVPVTLIPVPKLANGGLDISRRAPSETNNNIISRTPDGSVLSPIEATEITIESKDAGVKEMLTSLGLLCLISLLLALLSLMFLLKITPVSSGEVKDFLRTEQLTLISPEEYVVVYEITLALCSLTLSLNLCCLLVCAVQFLFAVKLVKASENGERTNKYLQKSNITRICAVGGFFISIPVFLTGIILYTFIQFHSTPAIITSSLIGAGIIFCGCAMVHNVFVWQTEKTNAVRLLAQKARAARLAASAAAAGNSPGTTPEDPSSPGRFPRSKERCLHSPGIPQATMDLSVTAHELSTLV